LTTVNLPVHDRCNVGSTDRASEWSKPGTLEGETVVDRATRVEGADEVRVVARPDGYYWLADDGRLEVGPFPSAEAARLDAEAAEESDLKPAETIAEAEDEIGIAGWIDPDGGVPAEEERPRIEEH